jgi:hypothetical protein
MKLTITMKTPDCVGDAIREALVSERDEFEREEDKESFNNASFDAIEQAQEVCGKWFEYGEYLYVEVDTDAGTIRVLEASR